jgi:hypothetical protein
MVWEEDAAASAGGSIPSPNMLLLLLDFKRLSQSIRRSNNLCAHNLTM